MGRRKCPTCGSKQWHKEPSSGLIACSEGHILQSYRNEMAELQELGPHAMRKRAMKNKSEKKGRQSAADPMLYHGARGRYHYLLCLQFILRKQIVALITLWDLPAEFEILCKDLWTLHLSLLKKPVPDEVFQEKLSQKKDQKQTDKSSKDCDGEIDDAQQEGEDRPESIRVVQKSDSNDEEDEGESELDSELEALMRENSEYSGSSSSENEGDSTDQAGEPTKMKIGGLKRRSRNRSGYETPVNTVAVLVVACWMLRVPAMYRDFNKLIERYELPYLDPLRLLPSSMSQHLTKYNIQSLSPRHAPDTLGLHGAASKLCKRLYSEYGILVPEANAASVLWRLTKDMGCTPLMYMMAKRIAIDRCVPLALHSSLAPGVRRVKGNEPSGRASDSVPMEAKLMSALIIVMKMVYGLDGQPRGPKDEEDVACGVPRKAEILRDLGDGERTLHVGGMGKDEMDEYIGFCEGALLGREESEGLLDGAFPLGARSEKAGLRREQDRRTGQLCGEEPYRLFAGEEYKTWDEAEGQEYEIVIERARKLLGVDGEYLNKIVRRMDKQR